MWGDSPGSLVKRTHEAWIFFTRSCGTLRAVSANEPNAITLLFEGLAPVCRSPSFLRMVEGGLEGDIGYVRANGTVSTFDDRFEMTGSVEFLARWDER
jgi:hypothetical protein